MNNLQGGLADYMERLGIFGNMILSRGFSYTWLGLVLLAAAIVYLLYLLCKKRIFQKWLLWMLLLPPAGYYLLASKMSPMYVDRYVMAVFPFLMMSMAAVFTMAVNGFGKLRIPVISGVLVTFAVMTVLSYDGEYLYQGYEEQLEIAQEYRELPCICLYEGSGYYDNLLEFMEYEETLLIKPAELAGRQDTSDIEALEEVVVLLKQTVDETECLQLLENYGLNVQETLMDSSVHKDKIYLMRKVENAK